MKNTHYKKVLKQKIQRQAIIFLIVTVTFLSLTGIVKPEAGNENTAIGIPYPFYEEINGNVGITIQIDYKHLAIDVVLYLIVLFMAMFLFKKRVSEEV